MMNSDDKHKISWTLLGKRAAAESNTEDEMRLNNWLNDDAQNNKLAEVLDEIWDDAYTAQMMDQIDSNSAWNKVKTRIHRKRLSIKSSRIIWTIAASFALILGVLLAQLIMQNDDPKSQSIVVNKQAKQDVTLSDGTVVAINGGSFFEYPNEFSNDVRKVVLKGEAFFNVTSDTNRPFIIDANGMNIKVVGTSFNIRSYSEQEEAEVTVESGIIEVSVNSHSVLLEAGEKALFDRSSRVLMSLNNDDVNYKAWNTRQIEFNNVPLLDAFETIRKVYKVTIDIEDDSLLVNERVDATFNKHSLEFVIETVCETHHLEYVKDQDRIVIQAK